MKKIKYLFLLVIIYCFTGCVKINFTVKFIVDNEIYKEIDTNGKESISIPSDPMKEGYEFEGWYWDNNVWNDPFTTNSLLDVELKSNLSVYAHFINENDLMGCDIRIEGFEIKTLNDKEYYYKEVANEEDSFSFNEIVEVNNHAKWSISDNISGNNEFKSKNVSLEDGDNIYYILVENAGFTSKQYKIVIHKQAYYNVIIDYIDGVQKVLEGTLVEEPSIIREGYNFICWNYDFSTLVYNDLHITSVWKPIEYTITYYLDGGVNSEDNINKYTIDNIIKLSEPFKPGYDFIGWYDNSDFLNKIETIENCARNLKLYAKWDFLYEYKVKNNQCIITKYNGIAKNITIPETINNMKVIEIGEKAFYQNQSIEIVKIYDGLLKIGNQAFSECKNLLEIEVPDSINEIGEKAFESCTSLDIIVLPDSLKEISNGLFMNCSNLRTVDIPIKVTKIDDYAFFCCEKLYGIVLPYYLESIGSNSFACCNGIFTIEMYDNVKLIDSFAFYKCENLLHVDIPLSVKTINYLAFSQCPLLTIYCEATKKPEGWDQNFADDDVLIIWDYKVLMLEHNK